MKKLNNKGMTIIEIILCFVLTVIITTSLYSGLSNFNNRRAIEGYKAEINTYKYLVAKEIQDDIIRKKLVSATYKRNTDSYKANIYEVTLTFTDSSQKLLKIYQKYRKSAYHLDGKATTNEEYYIEYGPSSNLVRYPLPDLGESNFKNGGSTYKVKDLSINNVVIDLKDNAFLHVYIGLYHPELLTRYSINISSPLSFISDKGNTPLLDSSYESSVNNCS